MILYSWWTCNTMCRRANIARLNKDEGREWIAKSNLPISLLRFCVVDITWPTLFESENCTFAFYIRCTPTPSPKTRFYHRLFCNVEYNNIVKKGYRNFHCSNNEIDFRNNILRRVVAVYQWKFNLRLWNRIVIILISKRFVKRKFFNYSYSLE